MVKGPFADPSPGPKERWAVAIGCGCSKGRQAVAGDQSVTPGTYRVMVSGRQVYESSSKTAADTVAARFQSAEILPPGQEA